MRAGFFGTPAVAVPALAGLLDVADVALVVTRPDRPRERSGRPSPPPIKTAAQEWGLPVAQPATGDELRTAVAQAELDVGVVVAYGRLLPPTVLESTRVGFVNIHFSLLPRWRGAAPVERAIQAGDPMTGVCLMLLDEGLDTGPLISVIETPISDDETGGTLTARLSHLGAVLLADTLPDFMTGALHPAPQISAGATNAGRITVDEARLDPDEPADGLERSVRAFNPRPGAWIMVDDDRVKIHAASTFAESPLPGVIEGRDGFPILGTAEGGLRLDMIQPAGKRLQTGTAWLNGRRGRPAHLDR